jgi:hypothetical protein
MAPADCRDLTVVSRRSLLGFHQPAMGAIAKGMILGAPAAADRDGFGAVELQDRRLHVGAFMGTVAKWQVFAASTAAIGDTLGYLFDDGRFNQVVVRKRHSSSVNKEFKSFKKFKTFNSIRSVSSDPSTGR